MTTLKLKDLEPGNFFESRTLPDEDLRKLEQMVIGMIKSQLPDDHQVWLLSVNLEVTMSARVPEVAAFRSYKLDIPFDVPDPTKKCEGEQPKENP